MNTQPKPLQLAEQSFVHLWQSYCDKKSENEDLRNRIAALEKALGMAVEALQSVLGDDRTRLFRPVHDHAAAALATARQTLGGAA